MKNRIKPLAIVALALSIIISTFIVTGTANADEEAGDKTLMTDCVMPVGIAQNPCKRAKVKAMYNALAHCTYVTDDIDNLGIGWALTGKWGGDTDDGNKNIGENLYDNFLNDIRNRVGKQSVVEDVTDEYDCTEGNLISEAFNLFAKYSDKGGKSWDEIVADDADFEERKKMFCDSGWFYAQEEYTSSWGVNRDINCREAIDAVKSLPASSKVARDYAFLGDDDHVRQTEGLKKYINDNYFEGWKLADSDYTTSELNYLYTSIITSYCTDNNKGQISNLSDDDTLVSGETGAVFVTFDWNDSTDELKFVKKFADLKIDVANPQWYRSDYTEEYDDEDCTEGGINAELETLDSDHVKAAKNELIEGLKEVCKKNYTDYFNEQTEYYNSLTDAQKSGDKKDYVEWYKKLPTGPPEDSVCFEVKDKENPLFKCKMEDYIEQFNSTNPDPDAPGYSGFSLETEDSDVTGEETYDCYTRAASLGWILCPIIDNLSNYIQRTYEQHITNFLVLDAGLFENGSTRAAWQNFQTIANVFFVIIFLVVILSQLTGFGIDNYGIKKILPKLILCAIIINLSYIICQLAVEIANIVGYGIGWIFEHIGTQITELRISEAASVASSGGDVNGSAGFAIAIIIGLVIILTAGAVLAIGPSVLVPIFLGLIAIAIAILSCFVILALRKALSVVLVVISPLAFLCYMLPNTKSLFNRWFKAFQGVLIAFPVCSAMVYGGQAVARLVINGTNATTVPFMLALSAAVIAVIPIFFIPRVVSRSMSAISAGINNIASRARATGQNRFRNSNAAQDLTQMSQQMRNRRAAGVSIFGGGDTLRKQAGDRISSRLSNHRGLRAIANARNNRLGRARSRYLSDLAENDKNARNLSEDSRKRQHFNDQVKNYMDSAAFEEDTKNGNMDEMYKMVSGTHEDKDKNIDWSTEEGKVRGRAMLKALAATKEGKKMLSSGVRDGSIAGDAYKQMAEDAGIRSAINEKDQYVAAALNSGEDWKTWYGNGDNANTRNVTKNLDKSDLYSQSGAAFQDALNQEGGKMITDERLRADMANPNIDMGDKVKDIKEMRGITASDPNAKLAEAMNNLAGEMKINRERGTLGGGYPSNGPAVSGHNAQQQSKNSGGGGGGIGNAGNIPD